MEHGHGHKPNDKGYKNSCIGPFVLYTCVCESEEYCRRRPDNEDIANMVDPLDAVHKGRFDEFDMQKEEQREKRCAPDGQLNVEDPSPTRMLDEHSTDEWSDDQANGEEDIDDSDESSSLLEGNQVANNQVDQHIQATTTQTLDRAPSDEG